MNGEKPLFNKGFAKVPTRPGFGVTLNDEVMKKHLDPNDSGYFEPTQEWERTASTTGSGARKSTGTRTARRLARAVLPANVPARGSQEIYRSQSLPNCAKVLPVMKRLDNIGLMFRHNRGQ